MKARELFAENEWYHCYTRGVDKRTVFEDAAEFRRFQHLLYLCNSKTPVHRSNQLETSDQHIYSIERGEPLVAIGAYCLMPNHFHLLLREIQEGGLSEFMRKLGIAYTMYFNIKHERVGNLFVKPFRAKHVSTNDYFKRVAQYIHLNPAELFEAGWKEGRTRNLESLEAKLMGYANSSLADYCWEDRPQRTILEQEAVSLIQEEMPTIKDVLEEASLYFRELSMSR
jgi:putative transposase